MLGKLLYSFGLGLLTVSLISCSKKADKKQQDSSYKLKIEKAELEIEGLLNKLDDPKIPFFRKQQILCSRLPEVYKNQYMPVLLKHYPNYYTKEILLKNFVSISNFYKKNYAVQCK
ncbi:TPA: hypothetical protein L3H12_002099 [Acinetobacter baumannii]|uniref:hypothetical protein n=1 Tax=Acinetobacter baumannii TaxID=470 RepID=UPI00040E6AFE|nr:hypothetical protein [Acinetobacter baumannii]EKT8144022.1 hypothetical protein [Acinetobacter baumannii]EKU7086620.1 hypothetical protein [Acinetobacter baumannii]EKV1042066.1 hypothetical protein [Acinetobacter baumannii]EKV1046164.1 hypothetical protein [Acinetobacter baumannii]EKV1919959.1 hypothetical protein [Acinetobacter baumannii]